MSARGKRIIVWSIVGLAIAAGLAAAFAPRPVTVDLVTVDTGPLVVTVDEEGKTRVHDVYVLSAPVTGRLLRIDMDPGDYVAANLTILAEIEPVDPAFLDPRSEAQARAAVQAAEAAHALARAEVDEARAELEFAQAEQSRALELIVDGTISQRDLDEAQRRYKTAKAALGTARAGLQVRIFELEQAGARLLSPMQTQDRLGECDCIPITSPVPGRVLTVVNHSERVVTAGDPLIEIGDPSTLEVVVDFLSADAVRIEPGQRVIVDNWGGDEPLEGRVQRVEPFGFTKVSALGIEEQRVNVVIDFTSEPSLWRRLGHGYQVEARVVLFEQDSALTIPLTALFRVDDGWTVFVETDGRARLTSVNLGERNGLVAQVLHGIAAGTRVIAHPNDRIFDGTRISPRH